ncbi:MAG: Ppx/GppA phosphatase family protein [Myxococcota bacterium]|nr:Ppx/GppA phosphatase family protein [Myxococcota bacterium]
MSLRDFAVLDLGSNSFHLLVTRLEDSGQLLIIDRLKARVRLAAGLDAQKVISGPYQKKAITTLSEFGERLSGIPKSNIQVVATDTFRKAKNGSVLLKEATKAVGVPIEIISGLEEARLIFTGVIHDYPSTDRRMIIDIGGGSTELVVGCTKPEIMASIKMGCVSWTKQYFESKQITEALLSAAIQAAAQKFQPERHLFTTASQLSLQGTSGTIKAIGRVLLAHQITDGQITAEGLQWFRRQLLKAGNVQQIELKGLSENRRDVIVGGYCILQMLFDTIPLGSMQPINSALREGVMVELIGRRLGSDNREQSIGWLCQRWQVDSQQARRVSSLCELLFQHNEQPLDLCKEDRQRLLWAAQIHEVGMSIAHSGYHRHGAYILEHADLYGFTQREQRILAAFVRFHRGKINLIELERLIPDTPFQFMALLLMLRLAVRLSRARHESPPNDLKVDISSTCAQLWLQSEYRNTHPLTEAELKDEAAQLALIGIKLNVHSLTTSPSL